MRNLLTSLALCALASVAQAQCVAAPQALLEQDRATPGWIRTAASTADAAALRPAAAGPVVRMIAREDRALNAPAVTQANTRPVKAEAAPAEEHPRRNGAMLLAVLAVMTGIALRRTGASDR